MRTQYFPAVLLSFLLAFAAAAPSRAGDAKADDADPGPEAAEVAKDFRKHCVQVYVYGKSHDGETPRIGDFAADIANLRPSLYGGYWWDRRRVLVGDAGIDDRFIRSIEIAVPGSEDRYPAKIAGRFRTLQAVLLEVLPNDDGELPAAFPVAFRDEPYSDAHTLVSYGWDNGEWRLKIGGGLGGAHFNDAEAETAGVDDEGILIDEDGQPFGAAFGNELRFAAGDIYWRGRGLENARLVSQGEYRRLHDELDARLRQAVLEVRFKLRTDIEDGDELNWNETFSDDGIDESTHEVRLPGLVTGTRQLFIPANLNAASIARIESIQVVMPDGAETKAEFLGAVRDYMAVIVRTDRDLPLAAAPDGFAFLNPMLVPDDAFKPGEEFLALPDKGLFLRRHVDYDLGRRRELEDYDRWLGTFRGFRGAPVVSTLTNERDGGLAFDLDGKLIAVALSPRIPHSDTSEEVHRTAGFRPLGHLHETLIRPRSIDPTLMPTEAENGRRLIDIGVEWQKMDVNTTRLFGAEKATRGGNIGLLVIHVYPDTPAAEMGLKEQDILLRVFVAGQAEPIELTPSESHMAGFSLLDLEDVSVESVQRFMASLPPPWPSRENSLSALLTSIGLDRHIRLEYLREGELHRVEFVTRYSPADYRNAQKYRMDSLGVTVKPITYEVARYYRRASDEGVILSKVEDGGRGGVAGLYPYLLITRVNGGKVRDFADFKEKVAAFESNGATVIELTVEGFGKTRLVKIER